MFDTLRNWYRRWVRMREIRYEYLAAILDEVDAAAKGGARIGARIRQSSAPDVGDQPERDARRLDAAKDATSQRKAG